MIYLHDVLRRSLPYGLFIEPTGAVTLFDRGYHPIARMSPDGTRTLVPYDEWIDLPPPYRLADGSMWRHQVWIYGWGGRLPPWRDKRVRQTCEDLLRLWGVDPEERIAEIREDERRVALARRRRR